MCLVFELSPLILLAEFPSVDVAVVLTNGEGSLSQPVTLDLTISLAIDSSSLTIKADNPSTPIPTEVDNRPAEEATAPPTAEISSAETALRDANKVIKMMIVRDTWRNACTTIELVMNIVNPITEVRTLSIGFNFN